MTQKEIKYNVRYGEAPVTFYPYGRAVFRATGLSCASPYLLFLFTSSNVGEKRQTREKNHLTIHKKNLAFPHVIRARLEPQR